MFLNAIDPVVIPVSSEGEIDLDRMRAAIDDSTLLVSVMLAQNETGVIHPVRALRDRLESSIPRELINGASQPRLPNTSNISFPNADATSVVLALDEEGICVSGGGACHSGVTEPTPTMKAMPKSAAVRFSLSRYTTEAEIDATVAAVLPIALV